MMILCAYCIAGNFQDRKFSSLSLHDTFRELNFEDLLDCNRILYYYKISRNYFRGCSEILKTAKIIVLKIFLLYGIWIGIGIVIGISISKLLKVCGIGPPLLEIDI